MQKYAVYKSTYLKLMSNDNWKKLTWGLQIYYIMIQMVATRVYTYVKKTIKLFS